MLLISDSSHIRTNRHRRGPRACRTLTGFFTGRGEAQRVCHAHVNLLNRRLRLAWLSRQWVGHQERMAFSKEQWT